MAESKSKPATKKAATKATAEAAAPAKAPRAKKAAAAAQPAMGAEERYKMIELAAYYIAQRNGFAGDPKVYWVEAEAQIAHMLSKSS